MRKNTKKYICSILACASLIFSFDTAWAADKLDSYRDMLMSGKYTIECEDITPEPQMQNKDKFAINFEWRGQINLPIDNSKAVKHCLAVALPDRNYMEIEVVRPIGNSAQRKDKWIDCQLIKNDEVFTYERRENLQNGKVDYWFKESDNSYYKTNEVIALNASPDALLPYAREKGTKEVTRLVNAMLPAKVFPAGKESYQKVAEGELSEGISYVDYRCNTAEGINLVRYYLDNGKMTKIASAIYVLNSAGEVVDGQRSLVKVLKFDADVDEAMLNLPAKIKDKTKRNKK